MPSYDPSLASLIHGLHHVPKYCLHSQGSYTDIEGIKPECKLAPTFFSMLTGRLLHKLIPLFGMAAVQNCLTGYADDCTVHRLIHSRSRMA